MKRILCDTCKREAQSDAYGDTPVGWLSVSERGNYAWRPDYCSKACLFLALSHPPTVESPSVRTPADDGQKVSQ